MTSGMPELGSKISLISKADIRYEGRLFTVDPTECTIALANVRSYGTEDRETQFPISPQNQVYDYILFRGSDIKDIRVVNNVPAMPNDPAIMQMQLPPTTHMAQPGSFQAPQFGLPTMGHLGPAQLGPFGGGPYSTMQNLGGLTASGLAPGSMAPGSILAKTTKQASELNIAIPQPQATTTTITAELKDQASVLELIGGGSRSTTPISLNSRKSPTTDMAVQANKNTGGVGGVNNMNNNVNAKDSGVKRNNNQNRIQRERRDSNRNDGSNGGSGGGGSGNTNSDNKIQQRNQQYNMNNQQNRNWNNNNRNNNNMRGNHRTRGRGPPMPPVFRQNLQANKGRQKSTIKFEGDYDFEQANNKFEELRLELAKLKVNEEVKPEQVNGETDKKDDSGNETGAGEHEQEEEEVTVGYDKAKSFFDNISCEAATDRSKGKNRTDWRHERKINSETFGVSSARRGNFYYRGRGGGYFNRNMNMGGGYRSGGVGGNTGGGYRSNNFRGRNSYNRNYTGGTGIPQQPTTISETAQQSSGGPNATQSAQPVAAGN